MRASRLWCDPAQRSRDADPSVQALLKAETPVVTIFGKSWLLHVTEALRLSPEGNLEIIADTVRYLAARVPFLIYDAEHFFDGYRADPAYALETLRLAAAAGAQRIVLCDTNGGSLPDDVAHATRQVIQDIDVPLGIHCHNDGTWLLPTLSQQCRGCRAGAGNNQRIRRAMQQRQSCSVIPNLQLKLGYMYCSRVLAEGCVLLRDS